MQNAEVFEKQAKSDFSKTCGRRLRLPRTNLLSAESKLVRVRGRHAPLQ
jgi:hypothetical protein